LVTRKTLLKTTLPLLVLSLGFVLFTAMVKFRKEPARVEKASPGLLVRTVVVKPKNTRMVVTAYGTVSPKIQVDLIPQVAGQVVELSEAMVQGGSFRNGDALVRIDPRDYELAVEKARADVARAEYELVREQKEGEIARKEWDMVAGDGETPFSTPPGDDSLLFRGPQRRLAEANLDAAKARLREALLSLDRTVITAPFNGRVRAEAVDKGQYVSTGKVLATVYGTDSAEIVFPVPDEDLAWFELPGASVLVSSEFGGHRHEWLGRVVRSGGSVDTGSRLVDVIVEVEDPFNRKNTHPAAKAPLIVGMFVEGRIQGQELPSVTVVPRYALREGNTVWVYANPAGELRIRSVDVIRVTEGEALIGAGLKEGEQVIVSRIDAVTDGMKVRKAE